MGLQCVGSRDALSPRSHSGRIVLVTGAGRGIGRAVADAHAKAGASVIYLDFDGKAATEAAQATDKAGFRAMSVDADVSNFDAVRAAVSQANSNFGLIDVLINNAGISPKTAPGGIRVEMSAMEPSEWTEVISINLTGAFNCCSAVLPGMIKAQRGRIVNMSSVVARTYSPIVGVHYAASKAGLIGMTKHMAGEVGPYGVTVNAVSPGRIETEMVRATGKEANDAVVAETPLRRLGLAEDVAGACLFLTSEAAAFITGQVVDVAGGWLLT